MCLRRDFRPASSFIFLTLHAFTLLVVNSFIIVTREAMCHRCESRPPAALLRVTLQACNQPSLARVPECHHDSSVSSFSHKLRYIPATTPCQSPTTFCCSLLILEVSASFKNSQGLLPDLERRSHAGNDRGRSLGAFQLKFLILHFYALCSFDAGDHESIPWLIIICVDRNKKEFPVIVVIGIIKIYTNVIVIFIITFIVIGIRKTVFLCEVFPNRDTYMSNTWWRIKGSFLSNARASDRHPVRLLMLLPAIEIIIIMIILHNDNDYYQNDAHAQRTFYYFLDLCRVFVHFIKS